MLSRDVFFIPLPELTPVLFCVRVLIWHRSTLVLSLELSWSLKTMAKEPRLSPQEDRRWESRLIRNGVCFQLSHINWKPHPRPHISLGTRVPCSLPYAINVQNTLNSLCWSTCIHQTSLELMSGICIYQRCLWNIKYYISGVRFWSNEKRGRKVDLKRWNNVDKKVSSVILYESC